jgi:hypothetical protein
LIDGIPLIDIGQGALITFVVLMVLTDRLVWHKRLSVLESRIAVLDETNRHLAEQNDTLLKSVVPTVNGVLGALHQGLVEDGDRS